MTNRELVAAAQGYLNQIVDCPVCPDLRPRYDFRGLFDINRGSYPSAFHTMGFSSIEVYQSPTGGDSQLVTALNSLQNPDTGWTWMSGFIPSTTGGSFRVTDAKLATVMGYSLGGYTVATHPRNSHRYVLLDDTQMDDMNGYTTAQRNLNLAKIADRAKLIHQYDAFAICAVVEWSQTRIGWLSDYTIDRPICDEIWLDGYANNDAAHGGYLSTRIADQARWAEVAGKHYVCVISSHDFGGQPAMPTPAQYQQQLDDVRETKSRGVVDYCWDDGTAPSLSTEPSLQQAIGVSMAGVTP